MKGNLRIAFVIPYLSNGGAERAMINVASSLYYAGHDVCLAAATRFDSTELNIPEGMKIFDLRNDQPLDAPAFLHNTKQLLKFVRKCKPDVVISTSDYLNISLLLARKISRHSFRIIIAQQIHASSYHRELPIANRIFIRQVQRIIARGADLIVCSSKGVADDYGKLYLNKTRRQKIRAIYNPIFEPRILCLAKEQARVMTTREHVKLITVGRLVPQKDHATLLKAFRLVLHEQPNARLFIIGTGPEEKNLQQLAADLDLTDKIVFLGYQANPYRFVAQADLFVLSSEYEGFGNVVVEALAVGTNVVATDCPSGPAEILGHGRYGTLCPVKDSEGLSKAIRYALDNKFEPAFLQERAKAFSIDHIAAEFCSAAAALVNGKNLHIEDNLHPLTS